MTHPLPAADPEDLGLSPEALEDLDEVLSDAVDAGQIAGVVALVARRGQVVHRTCLGMKDIASGEPLREDTIFRIFSMTKPITALAMMLLYEEGRWAPEDPIALHLPEFAEVKGPDGQLPDHAPNLRELMTHTAGLGYGIGPGPHDPTDQAYIDQGVWTAKDLAELSRRAAAIPLAYQPGSAWRYSISMDIQGALIERLTGQTLPDFMRSRIFAPLGMDDTDFYVPAEKRARLATLYHMYGAAELTVLDHPRFVRDPAVIPPIPSGGGGLYSTADDYARFAQLLLNGGELDGVRLVKPETVALMTANHLPQAITDKGVVAGFQSIKPGRGYAFNGAVFYDPVVVGSPVGKGTYQWDGASGVWFWIDPENEVLFVGMIQRMLQEGMPRLQEMTQALIAEALAG